jgi:hypothetical protein
MSDPRATKLCAHCGRAMSYRKRWERCWDEVRYCGERCRRAVRRSHHDELERAILERLHALPRTSSICPSEIARQCFPEDWREHMEDVRSAARRLAAEGRVVVLQKGRAIDAAAMRGPVRLALTAQ